MDIKSIQKRLQIFADERDWEQFHNPKNLVMALSVETSELLEKFQWLSAEQAEKLVDDPKDLAKLEEEIADVAIYLLRLTDKLGIDLEQAIDKKISLNAKKYPKDIVRGKSSKYTEY